MSAQVRDVSGGERRAPEGGPGIVVVNWTTAQLGLVEEIAGSLRDRGLARITCIEVGATDDARGRPSPARGADAGGSVPDAGARSSVDAHGVEVRYVGVSAGVSLEGWATLFVEQVPASAADAVIVLPRVDVDEPDATSRLVCAAIRRACGSARGPNVLVEVQDPEAAFEFVGLGVSTVFYAGHLRAALLGQACVDLGVYEFILGLLGGRHRIVSIPVPTPLRGGTFRDAALELELDERGRPLTLVGVSTRADADPTRLSVRVNPGARSPLRDVEALLALVDGDDGADP